jgi:hypothetical protein
MSIYKILYLILILIFLFACDESPQSFVVEEFLLPEGHGITHDGFEYYENHKNLLDSLYALKSDLRSEKPVIRKLNKKSPQLYEKLNLDGNIYSLIYKTERMVGYDREEDYHVTLNGEKIYQFTARGPVPIDLIHGFFIWTDDWILEYYNTILINGVNVNTKYGYDASFSVSIVGDELFYFVRKNSRVYLLKNSELTDYSYDDIIAYKCCDPSKYNPTFSKNILTFYAKKDKNTFFVQAFYDD